MDDCKDYLEFRKVRLDRPLLFKDCYGGGIMTLDIYLVDTVEGPVAVRILGRPRNKRPGLHWINDKYILRVCSDHIVNEKIKFLPPKFNVAKTVWRFRITRKLSDTILGKALNVK